MNFEAYSSRRTNWNEGVCGHNYLKRSHTSEYQQSFTSSSAVYWSEVLAANPEVPGSIPGVTKFSE
jgi:hypothetical protein